MFEWFEQHPALVQLLRDILIAVLSAVLGALQGRRAARAEVRRMRGVS